MKFIAALLSIFLSLFLSTLALASDWGGEPGIIERVWYYGDTVIVMHSAPAYSGVAKCNNNQKFSFKFSELGTDVEQNRVFSWLLAANTAKSKFRPLFDSSTCGPENNKKFIGKFEAY